MPDIHCTVAIFPPGNSHVRILIPAVVLDPGGSVEHAKRYALDAVKTLAATDISEWRTEIVEATEVEDAQEITKLQRNPE